MVVPGGAVYLGSGRCLNGNMGCEFYLRETALDAVQQDGPEWKYLAATLLPTALEDPCVIFEGFGRDGYENAICYCYSPVYCKAATGAQIEVPNGHLFLVYAEMLSGSTLVEDWGFREEDRNRPGFPIGWRTFNKGASWQKSKP